MYVCLSAYMKSYTEILIEQTETKVHVHFKVAHVLKLFNVLCDGSTEYDRGLLTV